MVKLNRLLLLALAVLGLSGCTTPTITNLTPSRLPRKDNGQYLLSVEWYSRQQSLIDESMKAFVIVGVDQYPMQRTPLLANRWETLVPVPSDQDVLTYRYQFNYDYRGFPGARADSKQSKSYQLFLIDQ